MRKTCGEIKRSGEPCRSPGNYADGKCFAHSSVNAAARQAGAAKGGKHSRISSDLMKYKARVVEISEAVLAGKVSRGNAAVAISGFGVASKLADSILKARQLEESILVETQLRVQEQEEIVHRMAELERLLAEQQKRSG
jgi:hypothetical protein